jgi:hypothetical protein
MRSGVSFSLDYSEDSGRILFLLPDLGTKTKTFIPENWDLPTEVFPFNLCCISKKLNFIRTSKTKYGIHILLHMRYIDSGYTRKNASC